MPRTIKLPEHKCVGKVRIRTYDAGQRQRSDWHRAQGEIPVGDDQEVDLILFEERAEDSAISGLRAVLEG